MKEQLKIIYSFGVYKDFEKEIEITERFSNGKYQIIPFNHRKFLGWEKDVSPWQLDDYYRNGHEGLKKLYKHIKELCKDADVFYVDHECVYHPDFIKELSKNIYTVYYSGDDPETSYWRSKPYLYAFDHTFCYGVYHSQKQKMNEKFIEWGAKRADLRPHGCWDNQFDHLISEDAILNKHRDIDIIFIGGSATKSRNDFLLKLKKVFGPSFHIYGNWDGLKGVLARAYHGYGFLSINKLPQNLLLNYYQRAKIGINIHQSFGPCNLRLYELPMNGIMQICDNKLGLAELYELDKEVVGYDTFEEAVEKIRYYLKNDEERKKIALNGYKKTKEKYLFRTTFYDSMEKIILGMKEKVEFSL
ncbi:MAG TPA: glycosyltransferase [Candidatus Paceibacterota bacterium]